MNAAKLAPWEAVRLAATRPQEYSRIIHEAHLPIAAFGGSFLMLGFVALAGFGILKATAHTKFLNFGSNVGAFAVFLVHGAVLWKVGLLMGAGQFLGAQLGSRFAMKQGARIIKPLLVTVSIALAIRLLADPQHPVRVWVASF